MSDDRGLTEIGSLFDISLPLRYGLYRIFHGPCKTIYVPMAASSLDAMQIKAALSANRIDYGGDHIDAEGDLQFLVPKRQYEKALAALRRNNVPCY